MLARLSRRRRRSPLVWCVICVVLTVSIGACQRGKSPSEPQSLKSERLTGATGLAKSFDSCSGSDGSFAFEASGTADGPYPGTFTEEGSISLKGGAVQVLDVSFSLSSGSARWDGKLSVNKAVSDSGLCLPDLGEIAVEAVFAITSSSDSNSRTGTATFSVAAGHDDIGVVTLFD
jgi:hypothetical protein